MLGWIALISPPAAADERAAVAEERAAGVSPASGKRAAGVSPASAEPAGRRLHVAGSIFVHVFPRSLVRSKRTRHLLGVSCDSVLDPHSIEPSASSTGLFFTGPMNPS